MTIGIVGRICGMTRVFADDGASIPVTVIAVEPNRVTQVKTIETDGYRAVIDRDVRRSRGEVFWPGCSAAETVC